MAPVILEMDVHCEGCAKKIRKAIRNMLGVERVYASPGTDEVVITGTADALALRRRLRRKTRKSVTIISDGTAELPPPDAAAPWAGGMTHLAPPPVYAAPPAGYPPYYIWGTPPPAVPYVAAPPASYQLYGNHWAPFTHHHYAPGGTPARFVDDDDDENPIGCCVQ